MVLHLAEHLDVPLRARNALLIAAGYAPTYHATDLDAPEMQTVRAAIERVLEGHEPYPGDPRRPAMGARRREPRGRGPDRRGAPELLEPPVQRAARQPASRRARAAHRELVRVGRAHHRRTAPADRGDGRRRAARARGGAVRAYATEQGRRAAATRPRHPARSRSRCGCGRRKASCAFITTIATFGTALDVTLAELAIEAFLPADAATASCPLRGLRVGRAGTGYACPHDQAARTGLGSDC